jgi:hypothetical protein
MTSADTAARDPASPSDPTQTSASITGELGGGTARPSPDQPATAFLYQKIAGRFAPTRSVDLAATLRLTEDFSGSSTAGSFVSSGDLVGYASLDATIDVSDHVNLGLGLNGSPPSTREVATTLHIANARGAGVDRNTLIQARTNTVGAAFEIGYDTFDEARPHTVDVAVDASAMGTRFATDQAVVGVEGALPPSTSTTASASLLQLRTGGTITMTILDETDIGLDAAYFLYDAKDPGNVGLFDVTAGGATTSFGAGIPMLPPRFTVRPEIGQRFGGLSLRAFYQYAELATDNGYSHSVGGKAQVALGRIKLYATGSYRTDIFPEATEETWIAGVGVTGKL